ncbi:CarD family transcriptional regulator [Brevibacillus formosus]|uniref:CarD family transcriptional regulator n=1 Tax=Brevibacillus formosus TaxID=54913 RepID=A0A220MDD2_9BACL|nr:CarD family transcriptional regulator [Brevibacillus formosus]ASJ52953.1 CarD family transcriptional regulator [Brevibacillus formosus]
MFQVGDKVFYPIHGAGVIEAMEEKEFLGEKHLYYVLNMLLKELNIMVPVEKMSALGIRKVVEADILENALAALREGQRDTALNAAQRYKLHTEKMKSGDIYEQSEVIRDLVGISKEKVLGTSDKVMLDNAQQLLISEIELVKDIGTEQATEMLKQAVCREEMSEIVP